jgi:hypothetical protein
LLLNHSHTHYRKGAIFSQYIFLAISQLCAMLVSGLPPDGWRIMKFVSDSERDMIEEWLAKKVAIGERKGLRIELETILRMLRLVRYESWARPQFDWLQGDHCRGIGELIVNYHGVPYRPLGCFGPEPDQFTILIGARKDRKRKGKVQWDPENAIQTAVDRKAMLDEYHVCEYVL